MDALPSAATWSGMTRIPTTTATTRWTPPVVPVHGVTCAVFQDALIYLAGGGTTQGGSSGTRLHWVTGRIKAGVSLALPLTHK